MRRRGLAALLLSFLGVLIAGAANVSLDGSQNLYPSGRNRFACQHRVADRVYICAGAVTRRTLLHAYATSGEFLLVGSTAMGKGASDILIGGIRAWSPACRATRRFPVPTSFSCGATGDLAHPGAGEITSRAEELAGPDTVPGGRRHHA